MDWDAGVLFWIRDNMSCGFLDAVMPIVSKICTADIVWFAAALLMICDRRTRKAGTFMLLALLISVVISNLVLKPAVGRLRPYDALDVPIIVSPSAEYSFPSGHATGVTVVASVLLMSGYRRTGCCMCVFAAIVMFSRMYLFMHYPTDIIGGVFAGIAAVAFASAIMISYERRGAEGHGVR
ncbi:MAG: phosphatase PAP2 family protein [Candidatus Methanomethylophilaceae archaeon]